MTFNELVMMVFVIFPTDLPAQPPTQWKETLNQVNIWLEIKEIEQGDPSAFEYEMDDFEDEIFKSRGRLAEIITAPAISFVLALPSRDECVCKEGCLHRQFSVINALMNTYPHREAELAKYKDYLGYAYDSWTKAAIARDENYTPYQRRMALKELKVLLGDQDFYAGELPYRYGIVPDILRERK
jgi:hypothetical protein